MRLFPGEDEAGLELVIELFLEVIPVKEGVKDVHEDAQGDPHQRGVHGIGDVDEEHVHGLLRGLRRGEIHVRELRKALHDPHEGSEDPADDEEAREKGDKGGEGLDGKDSEEAIVGRVSGSHVGRDVGEVRKMLVLLVVPELGRKILGETPGPFEEKEQAIGDGGDVVELAAHALGLHLVVLVVGDVYELRGQGLEVLLLGLHRRDHLLAFDEVHVDLLFKVLHEAQLALLQEVETELQPHSADEGGAHDRDEPVIGGVENLVDVGLHNSSLWLSDFIFQVKLQGDFLIGLAIVLAAEAVFFALLFLRKLF